MHCIDTLKNEISRKEYTSENFGKGKRCLYLTRYIIIFVLFIYIRLFLSLSLSILNTIINNALFLSLTILNVCNLVKNTYIFDWWRDVNNIP